jgi:uridine kinase
MSGMGYYRNAYDYEAVRTLLLDPAGPTGSGVVSLCSVDPLTQVGHAAVKTTIPPDGVLIVDGVFAFRPELSACWDLRIWIEIDDVLSLRRGVARDGAANDRVYEDRYLASERLYRSEVNPQALADVIIDNTRIEEPRLMRPAGTP